jgi:hypothetical protein
MREDSLKMTTEIIAFIERYQEEDSSEKDYNDIALKLFKFQFQYNQPYKKFCQAKRKTPLTVKHWSQIPPIPIQGFKELTLSCGPADEVIGATFSYVHFLLRHQYELVPEYPLRKLAEALIPKITGYDAEMVRLELKRYIRTFRKKELLRKNLLLRVHLWS